MMKISPAIRLAIHVPLKSNSGQMLSAGMVNSGVPTLGSPGGGRAGKKFVL